MAKGKKASSKNVIAFRPKGSLSVPGRSRSSGVANPWSARIIAAFERTRAGFFEIGRLLVAAKADLPHGEFINMIERELPFGRRHAQALMLIAKDQRLTNARCISLLPASMGTLYELARLDDNTFNAMLRGGLINPSMKRDDVVSIHVRLSAEADARRVAGLVPARGRFRTLLIDPPWKSGGGQGKMPYATMSQNELEDPVKLPVRDWLHEDEGHLYLWTTIGEMENAYRLMRLWDVEPQTIITWIKPQYSGGHYFRSQTEMCLFGTRGTLRTRPAARSIPNFFESKPLGSRRIHSEKPDEIYSIIRAASFPPYGEAFQRKARPGFTGLYVPAQTERPARSARLR